MNKGQWLEEFENLLLAEDWNINARGNPDCSYQLATAYFDWRYDEYGEPVKPEQTVEEAFERYLENRE